MPLTYYSRAATQEFWSEHWGGEDIANLVRIARASPLTRLIEARLPSRGPILEAGCGLGQHVILLRERGHAVTGVDWSPEALRRSRAAAPSTPLAVMDLGRLAIKDGVLAAYVSLGVVEHDPAGPGRIVAEAARAVASGGTLLLSVPYWNGARRLFAPYLARKERRIRAAGGEFYQFAFSRREVADFLEAQGFRVLSFHPYDPARPWRKLARRLGVTPGRDDGAGGAASESDGARARRGGVRRRLRSFLRALLYSPISLRLFAHMLLAVAIKR